MAEQTAHLWNGAATTTTAGTDPTSTKGAMDPSGLVALTAAAATESGELERLLELARNGEIRDVEWQPEV